MKWISLSLLILSNIALTEAIAKDNFEWFILIFKQADRFLDELSLENQPQNIDNNLTTVSFFKLFHNLMNCYSQIAEENSAQKYIFNFND